MARPRRKDAYQELPMSAAAIPVVPVTKLAIVRVPKTEAQIRAQYFRIANASDLFKTSAASKNRIASVVSAPRLSDAAKAGIRDANKLGNRYWRIGFSIYQTKTNPASRRRAVALLTGLAEHSSVAKNVLNDSLDKHGYSVRARDLPPLHPVVEAPVRAMSQFEQQIALVAAQRLKAGL